MESMSSDNKRRTLETLQQISNAIHQLRDWNANVVDVDDFYRSQEGMMRLAASSMLIEAIGEGVKKIDKLTNHHLRPLCPDIPWEDIIGMRNHIAHGYFDIDGELVLEVIKEELAPLEEAVNYLVSVL